MDDFLERMEVYKERKEEKLKLIEDKVTKDLTFKPKTYSNNEIASKYYER